ncbi:MAG: type II secretion system secretin GspD [Bdellovibrionota bacterium]
MSDNKSRVSLISIGVLFALIIANIVLTMPPRSALSDTKPARKDLEPAKKETMRAMPAQDFGAETIEPQRGKLYAAHEAQPLSLDLAEEPLKDKPAAAPKNPPAPETPPAEASDVGAQNDGAADPSLTTSLNGNEIDVAALVKAFSKLTKRNYIVDNNVKGKVAIHLATPVSVPEALRIFESVLLLKGFTTVPLGNNTWKVITAKDAKQTTIPMLENAGDRGSDALVTELIRLKNTQASELQQVLAQFVSKEGMINAFGATNSLILIDSAANIKRLVKLVDQLDVPAQDQDITIIPIAHAEAKDVAEKINSILGQDKDKAAGTDPASLIRTSMPNVVPRPGIPPVSGAPGVGVTTNGERRTLPLKLIPDERTNSLIVVADQLTTEKVKALAEQLDSPIDRSGGKFYVYRLQHADAEEMAQILNSVITGTAPPSSSGGTTSSSRRTSSGSSSSRSSNRFGLDSSGSDAATQNRERIAQNLRQQNPAFFSAGGKGDNEPGKVNLEGEVNVAADTATNSLVINASRNDYAKIKELVELLDVKRRQVLVEATILEVSLTKSEGMGVEFQTSAGTDEVGAIAQTNFGGITNLLTNPSALTDLTIAAASSGSIVLPGGLTLPSQAVLITALSRNQNVNVLSTPTVLAIDNQEAEIKVGENVPFVTSTSTNQTNLNNTFNQIERQDVGIKLRITPQISSGDFVVLKIFVEISDVVLGTRNDPNGPTTNVRTTETMVEVKSDQMVVTGGLIKDRVEEAARGVPFFQEIPVLGNLFRRDDNARQRTNLLIFITPRIVTDQFVARDQTIAKRDKMERSIAEQQTEPTHEDVLHSPDLDRVVESQPLGDTPPTTIRPPAPVRAAAPSTDSVALLATKRTEERLQSLTGSAPSGERGELTEGDTVSRSKGSDDEIELEVSPSLPGDTPLNHRSDAARLPAAHAPLSDGTSPAASGRTYVVLRQLDSGGKSSALPFHYADSEKTVGLNIPLPRESVSGRFFEPGERYTFQNGKSKARFVCIGKYGSLSEAKAVHSSLGDGKKWYTLATAQAQSLENAGWTAQ